MNWRYDIEEVFICDCGCFAHSTYFIYFKPDEKYGEERKVLWVEMLLDQWRGFFRRIPKALSIAAGWNIWRLLQKAFAVKQRYPDLFHGFLLRPKDCDRFIRVCNSFLECSPIEDNISKAKDLYIKGKEYGLYIERESIRIEKEYELFSIVVTLLNGMPWQNRLFLSLKYLLGYRSCYGNSVCFDLFEDDVRKIKELLIEYKPKALE